MQLWARAIGKDKAMNNTEKTPLILGIDTSCDDTAVALYTPDKGVLAHLIVSQIAEHAAYGGVVPDIASRSHVHAIGPLIQRLLKTTSVSMEALDGIAVTTKPGLSISLLIGLYYAKGLAYAFNKKLISIDHMEGHAFSAHLEHDIEFPYLCLAASGGHTALYYITGYGEYQLLGQTADDAAGEAFDKVAKLMHLPYPGGPIIEKLAAQVNFQDFFHYPRLKKSGFSFSFSGLKTAVLYDLIKRSAYDLTNKKFLQETNDLLKQQVASSFLVCVADIFEQRMQYAYEQFPGIRGISFVGGVACNQYIKKRFITWASQRSLPLYIPSAQFCTDNGAMIAFVGSYKAAQGLYAESSIDIF